MTLAGILVTAVPPCIRDKFTTVSELTGTGNPTVPRVLFPPATGFGEKNKDDGRSAETVKRPVFETPFAVAIILTWVAVETECTKTFQEALDEPAGTVTSAGADTTAEAPPRKFRVTGISAAAGALSCTVPVTVPVKVALGEKTTLKAAGGRRVRLAEAEYVPSLAVRAAVVFVATDDVVSVKLV